MNLKRMLLLLALSAAISAVAGPQKVKTSVEKVTLFIDGAQVASSIYLRHLRKKMKNSFTSCVIG